MLLFNQDSVTKRIFRRLVNYQVAPHLGCPEASDLHPECRVVLWDRWAGQCLECLEGLGQCLECREVTLR